MNQLNIWWHNKKINPLTKRNIKKGGKIYKKLLKDCLNSKSITDNYHNFRNVKTDPLTYLNLPLVKGKPIFEYSYCWEPLTGEVIDKDPRGSLFFDPDTLIYYFHTNRLRYLWNEGTDGFTGSYGDGLGNGPNFFIPGRGYSLHYYLFRLPVPDAFCDSISNQQTTIGPILSLHDITKIYFLACQYNNNYKKLYGEDRPNLLDIYDLYHTSIEQPKVNEELIRLAKDNQIYISKEDIEDNKYLSNKNAVDKLKII